MILEGDRSSGASPKSAAKNKLNTHMELQGKQAQAAELTKLWS